MLTSKDGCNPTCNPICAKLVPRETWLKQAAAILDDELFLPNSHLAKPLYRVSLTAPKTKGKATIMGECWNKAASASNTAEIFISAQMGRQDTLEVLAVLVHEMCHAYDNNEHGHGAEFIQLAKAVGLKGGPTNKAKESFTATVATPQLIAQFKDMIEDTDLGLGHFPHDALTPELSGKKTQTNRQLKVECHTCDFKFRASKTAILSIRNWACPACSVGELAAEQK